MTTKTTTIIVGPTGYSKAKSQEILNFKLSITKIIDGNHTVEVCFISQFRPDWQFVAQQADHTQFYI